MGLSALSPPRIDEDYVSSKQKIDVIVLFIIKT
jgi:hypothetical protein